MRAGAGTAAAGAAVTAVAAAPRRPGQRAAEIAQRVQPAADAFAKTVGNAADSAGDVIEPVVAAGAAAFTVTTHIDPPSISSSSHYMSVGALRYGQKKRGPGGQKNKAPQPLTARGFSVIMLPAPERYRSGHNGAVLKTAVPHGTVGSNPTLSATMRLARLRQALFLWRIEDAKI